MILSVRLFLSLALTLFISPPAHGYGLAVQECHDLLEAIEHEATLEQHTRQVLSGLTFKTLPDSKGELILAGQDYPMITMHVEAPDHLWRAEHWEFAGQKYYFVNLGRKQLEQKSNVVNDLILRSVMADRPHNVQILYDPNFSHDKWVLEHGSEYVHDRVIDGYLEYKPYLNSEDIFLLQSLFRKSHNCDVFVLLRDDGRPIDQILASNFAKNLILTLQASYYSDRYFFKTSFDSLLRAAGYPPSDVPDLFPHEYRLHSSPEDPPPSPFRQAVAENKYSLHNAVELTRLFRFQRFPGTVRDAFMYRVLDRMEEMHITTLLAGGDAINTTDMFSSKYFFSVMGELPTASGVQEFLSVLRVGSENYGKLRDELGKKFAKIVIHGA